MGDSELIAGTRNAYVHLYREADGSYTLSIGGDEFSVDEETAERFERLNVDGETIRRREETGDW